MFRGISCPGPAGLIAIRVPHTGEGAVTGSCDHGGCLFLSPHQRAPLQHTCVAKNPSLQVSLLSRCQISCCVLCLETRFPRSNASLDIDRTACREQVGFDGCDTVPSVNFQGYQYNVLQVHVHSLSEHTVRRRTTDTRPRCTSSTAKASPVSHPRPSTLDNQRKPHKRAVRGWGSRVASESFPARWEYPGAA